MHNVPYTCCVGEKPIGPYKSGIPFSNKEKLNGFIIPKFAINADNKPIITWIVKAFEMSVKDTILLLYNISADETKIGRKKIL